MDMQQEEVVERIKAFAQRVLPEGSSLWLYGSRARGDAHPDSDYDLLLLLNTERITDEDYE
ncbi:MAG: nucleotidyltransferase domain-containing protein, partial [Bacteroidales bacterium]|nr:nucleotidyltransferase domain-containing protein [Bacteroidales bacterium]